MKLSSTDFRSKKNNKRDKKNIKKKHGRRGGGAFYIKNCTQYCIQYTHMSIVFFANFRDTFSQIFPTNF